MMITLVVMLVSVLVIFKTTNYFGLQLKLKPLLLCAFCAFAVNIITLSVSSYLTFFHLVFIFSAVLLSACAVTFYNERLTLRDDSGTLNKCTNAAGIEPITKEDANPAKTAFVENSTMAKAELPPITQFEIPVVIDPVVIDPVVIDPVVIDPVVIDPVVIDPVVIDPVVADPVVIDPVVIDPVVIDPVVIDPVVIDPVVIDPVVADPVVADPVVIDPVVADPVVIDPVVIDPVVADPVVIDPVVIDPVVIDPVVADPHITETPDEFVTVEWSQIDEGLVEVAPTTPENSAKTTYNLPALITVTIKEQIKAAIEKCKLAELDTSLQQLTSLDSLLDYAYAQNMQHNYSIAIAAFQKALHKYSSDSYAPFIIIELGNIYKSIGSYDEALAIYAKAFTIPAVSVDNVVKENFQMNIDYLRIIKAILSKHTCLRTPFSQISQNIMQEIEMTFQDEHKKNRHYNN